jgi:MYXO-CTERM domain-containing protein
MTTALNVDATSTLDLTNNDVIVDYSDTDTTTGPAVVTAVKAAYDGGKWDLPGITSSMASFSSGTTLAVIDNANGASTNQESSVDGVTLDGSAAAAKLTWYGDANLDGVVNSTDEGMIAPDGTTITDDDNWAEGDFNYDGVVNADDWGLFLLGLGESHGLNISSVPEPSAALMLVGLGALAVRRRRVPAGR